MNRIKLEVAARWFCIKIHVRQWLHNRKHKKAKKNLDSCGPDKEVLDRYAVHHIHNHNY